MAEPIIISGVEDGAFDSALNKAFDSLPGWASDETAKKIEGHLKKSFGIQVAMLAQMKKCCVGNGNNKPGVGDIDDTAKEVLKLNKAFKGLNDEAAKKKKRDKEQVDQDKKTLSQRAKDLLSMKTFNTVLVSSGSAIKKAMFDNVNVFDQLYSSGINVLDGFAKGTTGFEAVSQLATITGVRFTELAATMVKYNTAVNAYGINKFVKTMAAASGELTQFGYTSKETGELLGTYLESQRGFADVNSRNQETVQKDLVAFGKKITHLSQATGVLRSKLLEDIEAISQSIDINLLSNRIGEQGATDMSAFISSFKDKKLGQAFLSMMTDTIKPLNTTFMDFQKTGFGGFGQKLMNFTQSLEGISDPEEKARMTAEFAKANDQELRMMQSRGKLLSQAGVKEADGMMQIVVALQQQGRTYKAVDKAAQTAQDEAAKRSKELQNQWESFLASIQKAFNPTLPMLEKLALGLQWMNTAIDAVIKAFDPATRAWVGAAAVIGGIVAGLTLTNSILNSITKRLFSINNDGGPDSGKGGKGGKGFGGKLLGGIKGGAFGAIAGIGLDIASDKLEEAGHNNAAAAASIASTAAAFAGTAALLGSVIPGIGTAVGAVVGGVAGAAYGTYENWNKFSSSPTTPKSTDIATPFTKGPEETTNLPETPSATPSTPDTARDNAGKPVDINSTLTYQTAILNQILESSRALVSVNKDILKYAKVNS